MLRAVFLDIDGTVLPQGQTAVSPELLDCLRRLTDRGVTVAFTTGRPYAQVEPLFAAMHSRPVFCCLDGAVILHRNCVLAKTPLARAAALPVLAQYPRAAVHGYRTRYVLGEVAAAGVPTASPTSIGEEFLKLELFTNEAVTVPAGMRVAYRSAGVTELVAAEADKGAAARTVMQKFGIAPADAAAFGDGDNDAPLLAAVGHPFRMPQADAALAAYPVAHDIAATLHTLAAF